jgi:hypothetical protein
LAAKRPAVLEVKTDPEVPALPPHITLDQAKKFSMSVTRGDSNAGSAVAGAARQLLGAILPDGQVNRVARPVVPLPRPLVSTVTGAGQPISLQAGPRYYATTTDQGARWGVRFNVTLLFPAK